MNNLIWKKNYINIIWLSLPLGASPSVVVAVIIHTCLWDGTVEAPWCCHVSGPMGTSLPGPLFPQNLCSHLPAHWPCVPSWHQGPLVPLSQRGQAQKVYPDQVGTPEELPFPMILIHPLLHSLGLMKCGSVGPSRVTLCSRSGLVRDVSKSICLKVSVPADSLVKNPAANAEDSDSVPGSGRCPGEGNGNPLWYSCLGDPMDRGTWRATVYRATEEPDMT